MQEQQIHTNTNDQHLAPSTGSRDPAEREQWWLWPVISLLGYIAVLVVNYLANSLPLNNQRTGDITDAYIVPFQPAGWVLAQSGRRSISCSASTSSTRFCRPGVAIP